MAEAKIPVDLFNPGQVFACLGFLEAADILLGDAEGGFDWSEGETRFLLSAQGTDNPIEYVIGFLARAEIKPYGPIGFTDKPRLEIGSRSDLLGEVQNNDETSEAGGEPIEDLLGTTEFPAFSGDRMTLPVILRGGATSTVRIGHWTDGSSREIFKLYSGNRSAVSIVRSMLNGVRKKPTKAQLLSNMPGDLLTKGIEQLWDENRSRLIKDPFHFLTPMGGSFNLDPRGAWVAIDAGYSPNDQTPKHAVHASPVVEFLAAWGLENARPMIMSGHRVGYSAWGIYLPPILARAALSGTLTSISSRRFRFRLGTSGKNKIVTFAEQEMMA